MTGRLRHFLRHVDQQSAVKNQWKTVSAGADEFHADCGSQRRLYRSFGIVAWVVRDPETGRLLVVP